MAQNLCPYLTKGKQICVSAHLHQDRWEKDGQKQSRVTIIADSVQLIGGNKGGDTAPHYEPAPSVNEGGFHGTTADSGFAESSDFPEDIPF
jgi:single-strand DNA-binding protein